MPPAPPRNTFSVIGRSLVISAATMFLVAFLIGRGTLSMDEGTRPMVAGALAVVGVLDIAIGYWFMRKGRSS